MINKILGIILSAGISLFSVSLLANEGFSYRIIGGADAPEGRWPSVVAIKQVHSGEVICGGNLIHQEWVVTAAHCVKGNTGGLDYSYKSNDLLVYTGSQDLFSDYGRNLRVKQLIVHPGYNLNTASDDIALIRLESPVRRAVIPNYNLSYLAPGEPVVIVGWGARAMVNGEPVSYPNRLNQAVVPIVDHAQCNSPASYNGKVTDKQICAGFSNGGRDSCIGDSGGPLLMHSNGVYRQIGIVSYGQGCGQSQKYGVYTFLPRYADWIHQYVPLPVVSDTVNEPRVVQAGSFNVALLFILLILLVYKINLPHSSENTRRN